MQAGKFDTGTLEVWLETHASQLAQISQEEQSRQQEKANQPNINQPNINEPNKKGATYG
ncbi:hypothetical protein P4S72_25370 [Vibrio sp. PP-XX7]